jgi:hypothetical protein
MKWRRKLRILHRDIGYAVAALVIAYSISGLAVNHIDDWNPNYSIDKRRIRVGPLPDDSLDAMEAHVVTALGLSAADVRGRVMDTDSDFRLFLPEGSDIRVDIHTGEGIMTVVDTRALVYEVNVLHLNNIKGIWTWVADLFAVALLFLAVSGLFMLRGKQGITGRGKWFLAAGLLVPVGFILYMYYGA